MTLRLMTQADLLREVGLAYDGAPTDEDLAQWLRTEASRLTRFKAAELRQRLLRPMRSLWDERRDELAERVDETIEAMLSHGDLLEVSEDAEAGGFLCLAPPAFVVLSSGAAVILGGATDRPLPLPDELAECVQKIGHVRLLRAERARDLEAFAERDGWIAIPQSTWLAAPAVDLPSSYRARFDAALDKKARGTATDLDGLIVLRPDRSIEYYRGRWGDAGDLTGRLLGRRGQRYGAAVWCYVELECGAPQRLLDLPDRVGGDPRDTAPDQAWRLQASIDAERGSPPNCTVRCDPDGWVVALSLPPPRWAERRLAAVGKRVRRPGAVVSYLVTDRDEAAHAARFYCDRMWAQFRESK